ncbi:MAG: hypothetical protein K2N54_06990 [Helicobacter sp.]|nr:hypothetical protein [Helicobacter sp.]
MRIHRPCNRVIIRVCRANDGVNLDIARIIDCAVEKPRFGRIAPAIAVEVPQNRSANAAKKPAANSARTRATECLLPALVGIEQ